MDMRNYCDGIVGTRLDFSFSDNRRARWYQLWGGTDVNEFCINRAQSMSSFTFLKPPFLSFCHLSLLYTSCAFCYCGITMQSFHCMATWEHVRYGRDGFMMTLLYSHHLANSQLVEKNCRTVECKRKVVCKNRKLLLIVWGDWICQSCCRRVV